MTDDHVKKMQDDAICAWKDSRHAVEVFRTEVGEPRGKLIFP